MNLCVSALRMRASGRMMRISLALAAHAYCGAAHAGEVACQDAAGNLTHCWDARTGATVLTIERKGDITRAWDPRTGRSVTTCEDRRGQVRCWPGR
jgi:hypothetical protein